MEQKPGELGSSLVFPSVRELSSVPERYVRKDIDYPTIVSNTDSLPQLPVIDLSKLLSEEVKGPELEKLDIACKEWGFFQVSVISSNLPFLSFAYVCLLN